MATALIAGLCRHGVAPHSICVHAPSERTRDRLTANFGVRTKIAIDESFSDCDVVVLAVKPQVLSAVLEQLRQYVSGSSGHSLIFSVVAGANLEALQAGLGVQRIVRAMPNTPAQIGMGMTGLSAIQGLADNDRHIASEIAAAIGEYIWVSDEMQMEAITGLSGSGPAYAFYFIEAMERAAEAFGFDTEEGRRLAIATFRGAAELARVNDIPVEALRKQVTSPGGTTSAAVSVLDNHSAQDVLVEAIFAATSRARQLGSMFSDGASQHEAHVGKQNQDP